ncbi:phosphoribosylformylglycinamidine synthase subunit PurL [Roseiconus lacunae]|uniref:Phosphoribosylformylglycinamidine synthase subunit PurL n=1 Tax=Roseiconus lacunae TaxID=2605694 RepID=A0ABT7PN77_9BACT|nr:phosphoribosylformylglycinamidine synthase subunit PurL [Roseiconus lacunae]MCD0463388.1 phosphoribosylformylglycinamidine synthase subunit PurL [Roseiconus lacunae]MDM4017734.1 phosphoribosylformylglycinamidine synthase subunit PurL [Roseiconus lacunae]
MPLWQIDIYPAANEMDREGARTSEEVGELGLGDQISVVFARGFLVQGDLDADQAQRLASGLLSDSVTERTVVAQVGEESLRQPPAGAENYRLVNVMPKAGVMDPVASSTINAARDIGYEVESVRTMRKYWIDASDDATFDSICRRALSNDSIEQVVVGPLDMEELEVGSHYEFDLVRIPIRSLSDEELERLSKEGQLYLTLVEMQTIRDHFVSLDRDPTDIELETIAQTWSEHCSHKTLAGRIHYRGVGEDGTPGGDERQYDNMLKETVFAATQQIRKQLADDDWCVSVFKDNAGVVTFNDQYHACFKVETHNHPSALEPYGGANTGIGGVIRDPMGTGMGAKPVCNTDVFCFAPPDTSPEDLPPGVLHPRRVMKGVVAGVRDYGNRMGIPTVNGAVYFDRRYLGNPLVYAGNVGMIPVGMEDKQVHPGDLIVSLGGRTGRDGIHGATFSSAELTSESESLSGGAVQIGNAITEKMVLDVLMQARDRGLYNAVTDCGAGGFSSAVGEMGEDVGAEVWLEKAPLKYDGLSYTEIWISEAQERMVLAVPRAKWDELRELCDSEGVESAVLGEFKPTGQLDLTYHGETVGSLSMAFLHDGRPPVIRDAVYQPPEVKSLDQSTSLSAEQHRECLLGVLSSLNVASKHWVIRQYDHEVQGGSVVKPLVGPLCDGPSDAAVVRPLLDSQRGLVISCGMNPHFGDFDTYHMAASAIDEAMRNAVAVGADPSKIAILDNFCWGYTDRPETLGSLVRAAIACYDVAIGLGTPFVSGKDSLNNEFSYTDASGDKQTISIPPSLLISAMGQIEDVATAVTMDAKEAGNVVFLVGQTKDEFGGSHYCLVRELEGGQVPVVDVPVAKATFAAVHDAIRQRLVRSCHDLSEGGLAVAAVEMAMAGGLGMQLDLAAAGKQMATDLSETQWLFSESNSRFLLEVPAEASEPIAEIFRKHGVTAAQVGTITADGVLSVKAVDGESTCLEVTVENAKQAWKKPLDLQ